MRTNIRSSNATAAAAASIVIAGLGSAAWGKNIVVNPSFEASVVSPGFTVVNAGGTLITGWGVGQFSVDLLNLVSTDPGWASDGNQSVDLSGTPGPGTVFQDLVTEAGAVYQITFDVTSNVGPFVDGLTLRWDGADAGNYTSPAFGTFTTFTTTLTASTTSTRIEFVSNVPGNAGPVLDNVRVVLIPAPGAVAALGLGGLMLARRRR